ncbi:hypothetical protein GQ457_01G040930 [Hibiscus cannabinus]
MEKMISSVNNEDHDDVLLPGFRFHPTDEELVGFYLIRKVEKKLFSIDIIKQVDIYKYDPWDLPKVSKLSSVAEKEWGSAGKGTKTDWMMHEFRLPPTQVPTNTKDNLPEAEVWTLCRIFKRDVSCRKLVAPDWQNKKTNLSKQNSTTISFTTTATSTRTSSVESENSVKFKSFGVIDDKEMDRKLVNDHFLEGNQLFTGTTTQVLPSYLSFSNPYADEHLGHQNWDELRPVVDYTLGTSLLYSDWQMLRSI